MRTISDICNDKVTQFRGISKINLLYFSGIISAIPLEWKILLTNETSPEYGNEYDDLFLIDSHEKTKKASKTVYNILLIEQQNTPIRQVIYRWEDASSQKINMKNRLKNISLTQNAAESKTEYMGFL